MIRILALCFPLSTHPLLQVGIEMKFKAMRYPVVVTPTHVKELNEVGGWVGSERHARVCVCVCVCVRLSVQPACWHDRLPAVPRPHSLPPP